MRQHTSKNRFVALWVAGLLIPTRSVCATSVCEATAPSHTRKLSPSAARWRHRAATARLCHNPPPSMQKTVCQGRCFTTAPPACQKTVSQTSPVASWCLYRAIASQTAPDIRKTLPNACVTTPPPACQKTVSHTSPLRHDALHPALGHPLVSGAVVVDILLRLKGKIYPPPPPPFDLPHRDTTPKLEP